MAQIYTYREKAFQYDQSVILDLEESHDINVFTAVRAGIDRLIESGEVFNRVSLVVQKSEGETLVRIIPA